MNHDTPCIRQHTGFTLIEVLVGTSILCVLLTLLFTGLWFSARSWDTVERRRDAEHSLALIQGMLAQQLRQVRPVFIAAADGQRALAFDGATDRLSFVAPITRRDSTLYLNTLAVEHTVQGAALRFSYLPFHPDTVNGDAASAPESIELLPAIEALNIRYFGAAQPGADPSWNSTWNQQQSLPERIYIDIDTASQSLHDWPELLVCLDGGVSCLIMPTQRRGKHLISIGNVAP